MPLKHLQNIRKALEYNNGKGLFGDTLWMPNGISHNETLFDYVDRAITEYSMILDKLYQFKGQKLLEVADKIKTICMNGGYEFDIDDPAFNKKDVIISKPGQVNCHTDVEGNILSFEVQ